jgi:hypothetical protein
MVDDQDKKRKDLADKVINSYRLVQQSIGLDEMRLAKERKRGINAMKPEFQKIKGKVDKDELQSGWKIVAKSATTFIQDEKTGKSLNVADGDTILVKNFVDHGTRQRTVDKIEIAQGLTKEKEEVEHGGTIIVRTVVPEPDPLPERFRKEESEPDNPISPDEHES